VRGLSGDWQAWGGAWTALDQSKFILLNPPKTTTDEVTVTFLKTSYSLSQKRLKPSLGNRNVHRRRNLDRTVCIDDTV